MRSVQLSPEARTALWWIEALGSAAEFEEAIQEIAYTLLNAQYKIAHRQVIEQMKVENLEQIDTEGDILSMAVDLTR